MGARAALLVRPLPRTGAGHAAPRPPPPAPRRRPGPSPPRRYWYDTCVFDRRALRYLIDVIGPDRLLIGTDFPAMPREQPTGKTLRSLGLPGAVLEDITWYNCFRFLGIEPPGRS